MLRYVADSRTIINPQGVRWAEKRDRQWVASGPIKFNLFVQYKGESMDYQYPDQALRDAQFDALAAALTVPRLGEARSLHASKG